MTSDSQAPSTIIRYGFLLAGAYNVGGIMLFSQFFTNPLISSLYPQVFSLVGMLGIMLWGLAYMAVSGCYARVPALVAVFALEKFLYVATWVYWLWARGSELSEIAAESPMTALFYAVYGLGDLISAVFFILVVLLVRRIQN